MSQNETKFKRRVLKDLKEACPDAYVLKTQERARKGVPDILICIKGRFVAIELKDVGKTPEAIQEVCLQRIHKAGGLAFWTDPNSWATHVEMIKGL